MAVLTSKSASVLKNTQLLKQPAIERMIPYEAHYHWPMQLHANHIDSFSLIFMFLDYTLASAASMCTSQFFFMSV